MQRIERQSARLIIVDDDCRVLLIGVNDPADGAHVWVTPGGGIEDGEDAVTAAVRELAEETGLVRAGDEVGHAIATAAGEFHFGGKLISTVDHYFFIRCPNFDLDDSGWSDLEREVHSGWRWWTCDELEATDEVFFPVDLADLVRDLFSNGPRESPRHLRWRRT